MFSSLTHSRIVWLLLSSVFNIRVAAFECLFHLAEKMVLQDTTPLSALPRYLQHEVIFSCLLLVREVAVAGSKLLVRCRG